MTFSRAISYYSEALVKHTSKCVQLKKIKNRKVIIFNTPAHGNLGDYALALAERKFFNDNFPALEYTEVTGIELSGFTYGLRGMVNSDDIIAITAGGFMGTLWPYEEGRIRKIINMFKDRKIFVFPQTVFFSDDEWGQQELAKSQTIYKQCKDLTMFAREKKSEKLMKEYFPSSRILLVPDMVLYYDKFETINHESRDGVLLCLRNDKEKTQNNNRYIENCISGVCENFTYTDTVQPYHVMPSNEELEVNNKLHQFAKAKLIVTDRLHGMIFAAITQTPCIVIPSKSHKVLGVYEWIRHLDYIVMLENISDFPTAITQVLSVDNPNYDCSMIKKHFRPLVEAIEEELQRT